MAWQLLRFGNPICEHTRKHITAQMCSISDYGETNGEQLRKSESATAKDDRRMTLELMGNERFYFLGGTI